MTPETNSSENSLALIRRVNQLYHDFQAATFDRIHQARHKAEMAFWRHEVAARLVSENFRQGIDLCSGTGFVASALLPRLASGTWVVCTDISTRALGRAERSLKEFGNQLRTCVASAEYLPFPDESVDWVTINAGLHHIPQPKKALKEVDRILKRGGYFFLGFEPNARFPSSGAPYWLERFLWHVFWYLSPRRNFKRVARKLGRPGPHPNETEHLDAINQVLVQEGLIEIWKASGRLFSENLLGVGAGNFFQAIGKYDARLEGRDAHSTPIRCCGELGIQGMALFLLLIVNAFVILIRVARRAGHLPAGQGERILYMAYGLAVALVAYLVSGLTMTLLYVEAQWWFLGIPVCLERVLDNLERGREAGLLPAAKAS